jgi:hypothetical protein
MQQTIAKDGLPVVTGIGLPPTGCNRHPSCTISAEVRFRFKASMRWASGSIHQFPPDTPGHGVKDAAQQERRPC